MTTLYKTNRLPSPQRGRGAGGEGEPTNVVGCLPSQTQPTGSAIIARLRQCATPPHPQPLSHAGARGAELSMSSRAHMAMPASLVRLTRCGTFLALLLFTVTAGRFAEASSDKTTSPNNKSTLQKLTIYPSQIVLGSQRASQRLVIQGTYADGYSEDLTSKVQILSDNPSVVRIEGDRAVPAASGAATIQVSIGNLKAETKVTARDIERPAEWSFRNHVIPVLTKTGCNMGACHGAAAGKNGFKLTLRGYDPVADYFVLTREAVGRRVSPQEPGRSLVLLKPTLLVPHAGGRRFGLESREYRVISQWIAEGTKPPSQADRRIEGIRIEPALVKLRPGNRQQVVVTAMFNDGYTEDVTQWVRFESTNAGTGSVDDRGLVELKGSGEASITAMYLSKVAVATLVVPFPKRSRATASARHRGSILLTSWS